MDMENQVLDGKRYIERERERERGERKREKIIKDRGLGKN